MEFHVKLSDNAPDVGVIEDALRSVDPAAQVDFAAASSTLRVATSVDARQLVDVLGHAGQRVSHGQVTQQPSTCCGGCGG